MHSLPSQCPPAVPLVDHEEREGTNSLLRQEGTIVLVSCYELGHQPIGLAQPIGFFHAAGYSIRSLDLAVEECDQDLLRGAKFVGVSVPMHTALRIAVGVAELVRTLNPACHICFYGLYASLNANYLLRRLCDSVIGGEYEVPLLALIRTLDRKRNSLTLVPECPSIEGVSVQGRIGDPALRRPPASFPVPNRTSLPALNRYARLERDDMEYVAGYVEASRGCLHTCLHCPIVPVYQGRFFVFPPEAVFEDIRQQVQAGARHITFGDPDFLNGPGHSLHIVQKMHQEFPDLTFDFTTKIEHILKHEALFPEFAQSGGLFVISAVESFSNSVLARLKKGHTREDIARAVQILRTAGITMRPSLVAFTPWTTLDDYLAMLTIVEQLELVDTFDPVQFSIRLLIPPGSALLHGVKGQPASVENFVGLLDEDNFQYPWTHADPRMDELHRDVTNIVERRGSRRGIREKTLLERYRSSALRG